MDRQPVTFSPDEEPDFFTRVYQVVRLVPPGRVTTYGAIARFLGAGRSARTVGYAMNAAHTDPTVPAHRVVNRIGLLTGRHHFETPTTMADRLEAEGVLIDDGQSIVNFDAHFWDPEQLLYT